MRISKGVSSVQVAIISIVVILIVAGGVSAYFVTRPATVTTTTVTSTTASTVVSTTASTVTSTATSTATSTTTTASTVTVTPTPTATPAPTFVYQTNSAYSDADPRDTSSIYMSQQSYETLTYQQPNGTITAGLATAWSPVGDGSTWAYTLRQGVTFHDGTTFNATDVVFSITNTMKWGGGDAPDVWDVFKSATVVSPYVVDLTFTEPVYAPIITSAAYSAFIFSHNILKYGSLGTNDTSGLHAWFNKYNDDGTGPYVINSTASSLTGGVWVLNQYKNYWGGWKVGQITQITVKLVTSVPTAIQLAQQHQLDWIGVGGSFQYVPQLLSAGLNVVEGPTHGSIWLLFNTQHQYLNNPLVRQALLTAINFPQIVQQAYYSYGINYNGMINPGLQYYDSTAPGYSPTGTTSAGNLTAAKALLVKAGFPSGALPGVTWVGTHSTGSPFEATIYSLLNTYWAPLGVQITITGLSFTNQAIKAGYVNGSNAFSPGPLSYASTSSAQDLALLNWNGATSDPWLVPYELFSIQGAPFPNTIQYNWSYFTNSTFSNLLSKFRSDEVSNPTQAAADVKTLNLMFYQQAPGWAMFQGQQIWVISPHWKGYVPNPNYSFDYPFFYQLTYSP
jgi:ABC-type transport system substrate-binding protein